MKKNNSNLQNAQNNLAEVLHPQQSIELLKQIHILTRDGQLNQDSRRKLKQIYHLYNFFEPILKELAQKEQLHVVDHGSGKSYLGFILYDLFFKNLVSENKQISVLNVESRPDLVKKSQDLALLLGFEKMGFIESTIKESVSAKGIPEKIQLVSALHACDTATDDAIDFALAKNADYVVLIPCCQAEVSRALNQAKAEMKTTSQYEIFRHPLHSREFGSHLTNVLRCLRLESEGYKVTVTEFTGLEHSLKNELIIAKKIEKPRERFKKKINDLLIDFGIEDLKGRFGV